MNASITSKAHQAVRNYLEMKDYVIVDENWAHGRDSIDFIARDGSALVFIATQVSENAGEGFPETVRDRGAFERVAAAFVAEANIVECEIRLDIVSLLLLGSDKALLKHHVNALAEVG